jgi:hypothetical protein
MFTKFIGEKYNCKRYMKIIILTILFFSSTVSHAVERFIPIELWLGIDVNETKKLKFYQAENKQDGGKLKIKGPFTWTNETTGTKIQVYERKRGSKIQYFSITNNGQCLGRVWDSRKRKRGVVISIDNGCKFPLGVWREGETREFLSVYNWPKKKRTVIKKKIKITNLGDDKKCLTFRWILSDNGKIIDDNDYTYCPSKGLTKLVSYK